MHRLTIGVILVAAMAGIGFSQSQIPSPGPRKAAKEPQTIRTDKRDKTESDDAATQSPEAATKVPASAEGTRNSQNSGQHKYGEPSNNYLIVWFTGVVAVCAFLQFAAMIAQFCAINKQAEYMRKGLKSSLIAARAAMRSAKTAERALKLTQRADVLLSTVSIVDPSAAATGIGPHATVLLEFINSGNTRAEQVTFVVTLTIPEFADAPANPL